MVDQEWLARTKAGGDSSPLIKAFTIAHEGNSDIRLDGIFTPVHWVKDAIKWINDKIQLHTPVFNNHGVPGDNSHEGRIPIGEIVGNRLTEVGDKVATVAAMYILPAYRDLKLDMASVEAEILYAKDGNNIWPTGINKITGIALADSKYSKPGFPEATLIGSIAAFAKGEGAMNITAVKDAVVELKLTPDDLFKPAALTEAEGVRTYIADEKSNTREHARRVEKENDDLRAQMATKDDAHAAELATLKVANLSAKTKALLGDIVGERKLDPKEQSYVSLQLKRFSSPSTEDAQFRNDLNKFVDEALTDLVEMKTAFGINEDDGGAGAAKDNPDADNTNDVPFHRSDTMDDPNPARESGMLDPDKNPLIAGGKADKEYDKKS